jgi:hypothetical protein
LIASESLLGLREQLAPAERDRLEQALATIWRATMGSEPGALDTDLAACLKWFDPVARGERLRRELPTIPQLADHVTDPGPPFTFQVNRGVVLVTPEGRCALELLRELPRGVSSHLIGDGDLLPYDRRLARLYRDWSRHRIQSVVKLLAGENKPLQVPAAGVLVALMVNRSTSEARALKRFASGLERDAIDRAFFAAVKRFAETLSPKQGPTTDQHLISGWMLYEVARRLGTHVLVVEGAGPTTEGRIWIVENAEGTAIDRLVRDLTRGRRARVTAEAMGAAFDALVSSFREHSRALASFGLAHERPANTQRLRKAILDGFARNTEDE